MTDARFEDAAEGPLHLKALDTEDLAVISAMVQDAVFPAREMTWQRRQRRFAVLLNRFRWEDAPAAERLRRGYERVQSVLAVEDVRVVASRGMAPGDPAAVHAALALRFQPGEDGMGRLVLDLSGGAAVAIDVECLDVTLKDVTRPYLAPSGSRPSHPETA